MARDGRALQPDAARIFYEDTAGGAGRGVSKWPPQLEHLGLQKDASSQEWRGFGGEWRRRHQGAPQTGNLQPCSIGIGQEHTPARGFVVQTRLHMHEGDKMGFDT